MRNGVLQRIVSRLLWFTVAALLVPALVGAFSREMASLAFAGMAIVAAAAALYMGRLAAARGAAQVDNLRRREAFLAVVLGWMILVTFTALAYRLTGAFVGFAEAFFESMSGFTTTGASVIANIEGLPTSVLFMRSFSQWLGGMGVIVLSLAILPELGVGGMQLFAAESSGVEYEKLAPRIAATARRLWGLYVAITAILSVLLLLGGMSVFDAINHAMATIATGGFSTKNSSIAAFDSVYIEIVITVFMLLSGISYALLFRTILDLRAGQKPERLLRSPEVQVYLGLALTGCLLVSINLYYSDHYDSLGAALRYGSFQTASILTTTGFGTADFALWPPFSQLLLVAFMIVGGCAGSTSGGFKVVRIYIVARHAMIQLRKLVRPRLVQPLSVGPRDVSSETVEAVLGFSLLYFVLLLLGSLIMTALGLDLVSGTTAAVSVLNSIGPGLGTVGAAQNFAHVPDAGLYFLSFGMLLGRLEIYPVLVLFTAHFWRRG